MNAEPACWCGSAELRAFSPDHRICSRCGTLVRAARPPARTAGVQDDAGDFYGREYWFVYQERSLGCPNIEARARADLPERCLHWLRSLLKYRLPPARVLELGSGPGAFVGLLQAAGYEATALELSPWVVEFIRRTFGVPALLGPLEAQRLEPASLDVVALMDVLEHLADPVGTMRHCLELLRPDGILLVQTPCYAESRTYEQMVDERDRFLEMLRPDDHLHIFSRRSLGEFFDRLGAPHLVFEPALFAEYDMFAIVSRQPLTTRSPEEIDIALSVEPSRRMIRALLDLDAERAAIAARRAEAERDRDARLAALEAQGRRLGEAEGRVNALTAEIAALVADRAARLAIIEAQGHELGTLRGERDDLRGEMDALRQGREDLERDRADRLGLIEAQGRALGELEGERNDLRAELGALRSALEVSEADRAARLAVIEEQARIRDQLERERQRLHDEVTALREALQEAVDLHPVLAASGPLKLLRVFGAWRRLLAALARARASRPTPPSTSRR